MNPEDRAPGGRPDYEVELACPACGAANRHRVLRARQVLSLTVPGRPFERAFGWVEGFSRTEDSPLYYGLQCCGQCRYPGPESDFRGDAGGHPNQRSLRRLFIDERAGENPPMTTILGGPYECFSEPERSLRLALAAIRAEMLPYPELWRRRELGRLYLRLSWLLLDESHFLWEGVRPGDPPARAESGPNRERLAEILRRLEPIRAIWPEAPLNEATARKEALRFHREVYERRASEPPAEVAAAEERQLAELYGLVGEIEKAKEMLDRAQDTCVARRIEENRKLQTGSQGATLSILERRTLSTTVQRLGRLAEEIGDQRRQIFGPRRAAGSAGQRSARAARPAPPKRRFRLFG